MLVLCCEALYGPRASVGPHEKSFQTHQKPSVLVCNMIAPSTRSSTSRSAANDCTPHLDGVGDRTARPRRGDASADPPITELPPMPQSIPPRAASTPSVENGARNTNGTFRARQHTEHVPHPSRSHPSPRLARSQRRLSLRQAWRIFLSSGMLHP